MVSAFLVMVTIYFIAPLFEALPLCVLASIVVVASIPLFVHYTMWRTFWRTDSYDFSIWIVSFFGTFLAGVDYGMIVGVAYSVAVVHFRMQVSNLMQFPSSLVICSVILFMILVDTVSRTVELVSFSLLSLFLFEFLASLE